MKLIYTISIVLLSQLSFSQKVIKEIKVEKNIGSIEVTNKNTYLAETYNWVLEKDSLYKILNFEIETGRTSIIHTLHKRPITALKYNNVKKLLISADTKGNVVIYSEKENKVIQTFCVNNWIYEIAISNDGNALYLLQGSNKKISIHEMSGRLSTEIELDVEAYSMCIKESESILIGGHNKYLDWSIPLRTFIESKPYIGFYDILYNKVNSQTYYLNNGILYEGTPHSNKNISLHFKGIRDQALKENILVTGSKDFNIAVVEIGKFKILKKITNPHEGEVLSVNIIDNRTIISSGENQTLMIHKL